MVMNYLLGTYLPIFRSRSAQPPAIGRAYRSATCVVWCNWRLFSSALFKYIKPFENFYALDYQMQNCMQDLVLSHGLNRRGISTVRSRPWLGT